MEIKNCTDLNDARSEIDKIDEEIVKLLAARGKYVRQAVKLSNSLGEVQAPVRVKAVVEHVRSAAMQNGLQPAIAENTFRTVLEGFFNYEMNELSDRSSL